MDRDRSTQSLSVEGREQPHGSRIEALDSHRLQGSLQGPKSLGALLDSALEVFRLRFVVCTVCATLLWIPFHVLDKQAQDWSSDAQIVAGTIGLSLAWIAQSLTGALVALIVNAHVLARPLDLGSSLRTVILRLPALLMCTLLAGAMVLVGLLMCLLPGVVMAWLFAVSSIALVLERLGPLMALGRGAVLMRNSKSFWRWLAVVLLANALFAPFSAAAEALQRTEVREFLSSHLALSAGAYETLDLLLSAVFLGVPTAFSGVLLTILYLDARVRSEGFDLRMRLEQLRLSARGQQG